MAGSRTPRQGKYRNHLGQPLGLLGHGACGGGRFLHQRGVLLRHLVELPYRLVDLGNAGRLVARSRVDLPIMALTCCTEPTISDMVRPASSAS